MANWVISELERVRVVTDDLIAWHSTYLNGRSWGIELTQPTIDRPFTDGHYANAALVGQRYVRLGVAPVWLDYWDGDLDASGFVAHRDTKQGRESGKTDPGPEFDPVRFIDSLEEEMTQDEFNEMYRIASKTVAFPMRDKNGSRTTGNRELVLHLDDLRRHGEDSGKHSAGGLDYTDDEAVQAVIDKLSG